MINRSLHFFSWIVLGLTVAVGFYGLFLQLDPRETFYLEEDKLATNRLEYMPGDEILLKFRYCSKKDQIIEGNFILRDGIRVDGETKVLPVYEGCGTIWLEVFEVSSVTYGSTYSIEGMMSYRLNSLKTISFDVVSEDFEIKNEGSFLIDEFDVYVNPF